MIIGRIITKQKIDVGNSFEITDNIEIYSEVPTLIVGYEMVQELFNEDDIDFCNRNIDGIFWTFSKTDNKKYYIIDLEYFIDYCVDKAKEIPYFNVNVLNRHQLLSAYRAFRKCSNAITYFDHRFGMYYVLMNGKTFGFKSPLISNLFGKERIDDIMKRYSSHYLTEKDLESDVFEILGLMEDVMFVPHIYYKTLK